MKILAITTVCLSLALPLLAEDKPASADKETQQKLEKLIAQLNNEDFDEQEKASGAIAKIGKPALPALIEAAKNKSDSGTWAKRLIQQLGWNWETAYAKKKAAEHIHSEAEPSQIDSEALQKFFPEYRFYLKEAVKNQVGTYRARYAIKLLAEDAILIKEDNAPGTGGEEVEKGFNQIVAIARDSNVKLSKAADVIAFHHALQPVLWSEWIVDNPKIEKTEKGWKIEDTLTCVIEVDENGVPTKFYPVWKKQ